MTESLGMNFSFYVSWKQGSTVTFHDFDKEFTQRTNIVDKNINLNRVLFMNEDRFGIEIKKSIIHGQE